MSLIQISIKKSFLIEDPDGYPTKAYHTPCTPNPPVIGKTSFSTEIKLAQGVRRDSESLISMNISCIGGWGAQPGNLNGSCVRDPVAGALELD